MLEQVFLRKLCVHVVFAAQAREPSTRYLLHNKKKLKHYCPYWHVYDVVVLVERFLGKRGINPGGIRAEAGQQLPLRMHNRRKSARDICSFLIAAERVT